MLICVITFDLEYNLTAREGTSGKYVTMCPFLSFSHVEHKTKLCVEYTGIYQGKTTTRYSFSLRRRKTIRLFFDHLILMEIHEILRYIPSPLYKSRCISLRISTERKAFLEKVIPFHCLNLRIICVENL